MIPRAGTAAAHLGCGRCDDGGVEHRDAAAEELNGGVLSPAPASVLVQASSGRGHGAPADLVSAPRAVTRNSRRRLVRVACGGLEDGNGREGEEGEEDGGDDCVGARAERRPAPAGLVWDSGLCLCAPGRGEFGGLFAPFSDGCSSSRGEGREGGRATGAAGDSVLARTGRVLLLCC